MKTTKTLTVRRFVLENEPSDHYLTDWKRLRHQIGCELYDALYQLPLPAVVDITERVDYPRPGSEISSWQGCGFIMGKVFVIEATITPVEHRHVVISHSELDSLGLYHSPSFLRRLRYLITGK